MSFRIKLLTALAVVAVGCGEGTPGGSDGGAGGGGGSGGTGGGSAGGGAGGGSAGGGAGGGSAGGGAGGGSAGGGAGGGSAGGSGGSGGGTAQPGTVVAVAAGNTDFSILVAAVKKAGLESTLNDTASKFTVFAPTNAAFTKLLTDLGITNGLDGLTPTQLSKILTYHVLPTEVRGAAATTAAMANMKVTAVGGKIQLSLQGSTIRLDSRASVTMADINASNGVIHVIDAVILPSIADIATTTSDLSSLVAAAALADTASPSPGFVSTLDNDAATLTVFAPTNTAFTGLVNALKGSDNGVASGITALTSFRPDQVAPVIAYHVMTSKVLAGAVPTAATKVDTLGGKVEVQRTGTAVTVDGTSVLTGDLIASNGVVHLIGSVLLPSITDMVTTNASLATLKGLVVAADSGAGMPKVAAALDGTTKFTLFAPRNTVTVPSPAPAGQALTDVLLYHAATGVTSGPQSPIYAGTALTLTAAAATVNTALATKTVSVRAEGSPLGVTVADSTATKANVTVTNLFTSNGVIHIVDKILIP